MLGTHGHIQAVGLGGPSLSEQEKRKRHHVGKGERAKEDWKKSLKVGTHVQKIFL